MILSIILALLLGIFLPVLLPLIPNVTLTIGEQIIIGILSATVPVLIEIARDITKIRKSEEISQIILKSRNVFDVELLKLSNYFVSFDDVREKGIFSSYFMKEILGISELMLDASEKHKFSGRVQHVVDDNYILSCFGRTSKHWKLTWILEGIGNPVISNDDAWNSYFNQAVKLLEKKALNTIDVLFIAEDDIYNGIVNDATCGVRMYVEEFKKKNRLSFKIVNITQYDENYRNAFRNQIVCRDIGIYGQNLLFIYDNQNSDYGVYNENDSDIIQYNTFYDSIWTISKSL